MDRTKTTLDLGNLDGKILVFGGVYSNLQALTQMRHLADELQVDHVINTGDLVGYCAEPEACVQLVQDWGIHSIAGNVELQLREGEDDCGCDFNAGSRCDVFSRQWYPYAQAQLSDSSLQWMHQLSDFLRFTYAGLQALVVHGSLHETAEYVFASTPWEKKQANFTDGQADLILAGHCGLPFHDVQAGKYWLNPGVIGMPANNGSTKVWYMLINTNEKGELTFAHHELSYDFETASQHMRDNQLPQAYALTLQTGIWDNCEILPEVETKQQGQPIFER